jgi:hypothetical protein
MKTSDQRSVGVLTRSVAAWETLEIEAEARTSEAAARAEG